MHRIHRTGWSSLITAALLVACAEGGDTNDTVASQAALVGQNGILATSRVTSNWDTGYCVEITVTNNHATATTNTWNVVVDVGAATTYTAYSAVFSAQTGAISATPLSWNNRIAPNGGSTMIGLCVNKKNKSDAPVILSVTSDLPIGTSSTAWAVGLYRLASRADRLTMTAPSTTALDGESYHGGSVQQWRFVDQGSSAFTLVNENNKRCLVASGSSATLGNCSTNPTRWTIEALRASSTERPGLYRLRTATGATCLVPNGTASPGVGSCSDAARLYIEPVGYGERTLAQQATLRPLLIVKPTTATTNPVVQSTIPADIVAAVQVAFRDRVASWYERMTDGRVKWNADVVVSPRPLTQLSATGTDANGVPNAFWPYASDMADDVAAYMPIGTYDGAIAYWTSGTLDGGWGWGTGPGAASNYAGWGTANYNAWITTADVWTSWSHEPTEVFIHEFLEEMTMFYDSLGIPLPQDRLHGVDTAKYTNVADGWKPWYRDYILGTVISPDDTYVGLGPRAWAKGTPKDLALVHSPSFLTPARLAQNLLSNGTFEGASGSVPTGWVWDAWQNDGRTTAAIDTSVKRSGSSSLKIQSTSENDARYIQTIAAQPNQRYVLAGWIKTQAIGGSGSTGANIGDMRTGVQAQPTLLGTKDWTYVATVLVSGADGIIDVAARLGSFSSTVTGTAWFDDLALIRY